MNKALILIAASIQFILSGCSNILTVNVSNPLEEDRRPELVELSLSDIQAGMGIDAEESFVIQSNGAEVPYQITFDGKVVFPATLKGQETQTFTLRKGKPAEVTVKVCGAHYPERVDDLCWENDVVGFRTYGFKEDKASGYDIFTKRNTDLPAIPEMYRKALDPEMKKIRSELAKVDKDSSEKFSIAHMSFHVDHGYGADFYAVGPTLGAGTSALIENDQIIYPFCFDTYEILDNGPLRFTIKLTFRPFKVGNCENVIETRYISLDLGSHFNKTVVSFENLDKATPIVSGIVVQDKDGKAIGNADKGYITYPAPTMNFDKFKDVDNGIIYVGNVFPSELDKAEICYFSEKESKERGGAKGHILAQTVYNPDKEFVYYWGFGWNYADTVSYEDWIKHVEDFSAQLRTPITVTLK